MEGIRQFVKEGRVVWTMTTNGYKFYTLNLISWLRDVAKVPWQLCILCADSESYTFFRREGYPCISFNKVKGQQSYPASFGSSEFGMVVKKKLDAFLWIAENAKEYGISKSLFLDGDLVVQRDPLPVLEGLWEGGAKELLFQCDCANDKEHLDCGVACTGVVAIQHTMNTSDIWRFEKGLWSTCENNDQAFVQKRLKALQIPFGILPRPEWCNGMWQKSMKWKDHNWVLIHYNYRVGDTKKAAMKSYGHWRIPY